MNTGKYEFSQIVDFLPKRFFERLITNCKDRTVNMSPSISSHLLYNMFGHLIGCRSPRKLIDISSAYWIYSFHLGFGKTPNNRIIFSKVNNLRNPKMFEHVAYHIVSIVQIKRITKGFKLYERFYAIDLTTDILRLKTVLFKGHRNASNNPIPI